MEDRQIVELYWQRDPAAIERSAQKYGAYCFSVAGNVLGSREDAEECVNDTWYCAWEAMPPHRPNVLRMFFAKIARRLAIDRLKAAGAQKRGGGELNAVLGELSESIAGEEDVEDALIAQELAQTIRSFVGELPVREGDLFVRRYFFTEPVAEIAKCYGLTAGYVSVMLHRTREKLRDRLKKEGYFS